jgi:hypothetical protein
MPLGVSLDCPNDHGGRSPIFVARLILARGVPVDVLETAVDRLKTAYALLASEAVTLQGRDAYLLLVARTRTGGPPPPYTKRVAQKPITEPMPACHEMWSAEDIRRLRAAYRTGGRTKAYDAFPQRTPSAVSRALRFWVFAQRPLTPLQQHVLRQYPTAGIEGCLTHMPHRKNHNRRRDVMRAILRLRKIGLLDGSED